MTDVDRKSDGAIRLFYNHREAFFVRRPNRFLIIARSLEGEEIPCHCPNPGRLLEFVIPGSRLILEHRGEGDRSKNPKAKTQWTTVGVYYRNAVVPLFSARANGVTEVSVLPRLFPQAQEIRPEYTLGHSRFDFFVIDAHGQRHLVEVKACSLVENGVAMFPDAPSDRASKHLEELAALTDSGYRCHIVFMIVHGNPRFFMPNPHTDPLFASTLSRLSPKLHIHGVLLSATADGYGRVTDTDVPVDLSYGPLAEQDRGSYMMLLHLPQDGRVQVGHLGEFDFPQGWYVYAGSAQKNLKARIARHQRRVKQKLHWHLDYLSPYADKIIALPVAGYTNLECRIAQALADLGGRAFQGFGSSDCACPSHLYYFADPPLKNRAFVDLLFQVRHVWALQGPSIR